MKSTAFILYFPYVSAPYSICLGAGWYRICLHRGDEPPHVIGGANSHLLLGLQCLVHMHVLGGATQKCKRVSDVARIYSGLPYSHSVGSGTGARQVDQSKCDRKEESSAESARACRIPCWPCQSAYVHHLSFDSAAANKALSRLQQVRPDLWPPLSLYGDMHRREKSRNILLLPFGAGNTSLNRSCLHPPYPVHPQTWLPLSAAFCCHPGHGWHHRCSALLPHISDVFWIHHVVILFVEKHHLLKFINKENQPIYSRLLQ